MISENVFVFIIGVDVLNAGIATHYCKSEKIQELEKALLDLKNVGEVDNVINDFCPKPKSEFVLAKHLDQINKCFNAATMEEILDNLEKDNSEWAKQTVKVKFKKNFIAFANAIIKTIEHFLDFTHRITIEFKSYIT